MDEACRSVDGEVEPDDPTDAALRQVTRLAATVCRVPLAIVTLEGDRAARGSLADARVAAARGYHFHAAEPLVDADGARLGTLCLLDRTPREITDDLAAALREIARVAADQVVLARAAAEARRTADQLQDGLLSNRTIGKALGLLMVQYRLDDEAAFAKLRDHSRDLNMKVREIAERVVEHHNSGCRTGE